MGEAALSDPLIIWEPQAGPQTALLTCPVFEVFYGGARGGGKTDGMLGEWVSHADLYGSDANGVFFRRELIQLDEAIERSKEIFSPLGAVYRDQKKVWTFPNGARLKFRPLERDSDAEKYQGHSYTRVYFEELTNFPDIKPVMKMKATLRSRAGVPTGFRATGNPGGPGHQWVKARYIDPAPIGYKRIIDLDEETGIELDRVFIPAKLKDNKLLIENDPAYIPKLKQSGSEQLVKAWLEGDWNVIEGAYFDCWDTKTHVIRPIPLPKHWLRFRSFDWGSAKPFSVGWWAISDGELLDNGQQFPRGSMIRYREWYGAKGPNIGLKLTAEQVAEGILEKEEKNEVRYGTADPSIWKVDGGPSIAERMYKAGVTWRKADNQRINGWDQLRGRLVGDEDGISLIYTFSTCIDSIRTIPALQHDSSRAEELDTDAEDHAADEWRYACMSRPRTLNKPDTTKVPIGQQPTLNQRIKRQQNKKPKQRKRI